jgi:hypothetical protein
MDEHAAEAILIGSAARMMAETAVAETVEPGATE